MGLGASDELLARHHVLVAGDNPFQREARLRQALWREAHGLPVGVHRGKPLGSRLAMPFARESLANYMTEVTREVVRAEVTAAKAEGKLYGEPRIFEDLLSSQPLCFNIFAELQRDLALATRTFAKLLPRADLRVTAVEFEHSPGRGDPRFTGDHSAFDVFVELEAASGERGFVGIEVKYVENLQVSAARLRPRYEEVADAMGVFLDDARPRLRLSPLQQFWRDHLLAGSLLLARAFAFGWFVVLAPRENTAVASGLDTYRACLRGDETFAAWTLEDFLSAIATGWSEAVRARYLGR